MASHTARISVAMGMGLPTRIWAMLALRSGSSVMILDFAALERDGRRIKAFT